MSKHRNCLYSTGSKNISKFSYHTQQFQSFLGMRTGAAKKVWQGFVHIITMKINFAHIVPPKKTLNHKYESEYSGDGRNRSIM